MACGQIDGFHLQNRSDKKGKSELDGEYLMVQNLQFRGVGIIDQDLEGLPVKAAIKFVCYDVFVSILLLIGGEELEEVRRDAGEDGPVRVNLGIPNL